MQSEYTLTLPALNPDQAAPMVKKTLLDEAQSKLGFIPNMYCVMANSPGFLADQMSGVPAAVTDAIRDGTSIPNVRLAALHDFTRNMVTQRGLPSQADVRAFLATGFNERQILEVMLAMSVKTLSNYANHLFHTPLDNVFAGRAWTD